MSDPVSGAGAAVVPAVATGSSLACVRSLGRRGVHVIAASERPSPPSARSRYCAEFERVPDPWTSVQAYKRGLVGLAKRPAVRTIYPVREVDVYVLSKYRDEFAPHVAVPWPPYDVVRTVQDRLALFEAADRADVDTPASRPADRWDRWDGTTVVKSRYSILVEDDVPSYPGVRFVGGDGQGEHGQSDAPPDVEALRAEMGHVPLAQEYVPGGEEYGFFALYDEGSPVWTFQHRRVRSYTYTGGASVFRRAVHVPELERAGTRLLDELDWHGVAMVEFRRDPTDGAFKLMEINPRFWGSLALAVTAGVDFPLGYYRLAGDGVDAPAPDYETGVGCHVLHGEASYVASLVFDEFDHLSSPPLGPELAAIGRSLVTDPHFDYLSIADPGPFAAIAANAGRDAAGKVGDWLGTAVGLPRTEDDQVSAR